MSIVLVRRNKLGRGSCNGIAAALVAQGVQARVVRNWIPEEMAAIQHDEDLVVRWGCTSTLPGVPHRLLNPAAAIHWCSDKRAGRLAMQEAGVPVPQTWGDLESFDADEAVMDHRGVVIGDFVVRPRTHAQGRNLLVVRAGSSLMTAEAFEEEHGQVYIARLIPKVAEYRFFIMHGRVVWCARKTPGNPDDVAWNVARGGRFDNVRWEDWPLGAAKACIQAALVSGTDFCGVDVMIDAEGQPYVLEVNSAPSQTSPYRQGCVARALKYVLENGRDVIPLPPNGVKTYKGVRHPALKET